METISFVLGMTVSAGKFYSFQGYTWEALRSGRRNSEPKQGANWKLGPAPTATAPAAPSAELTAAKATVAELTAKIAALEAEKAKLTATVAELDREQKLCVCGSPSGIVSPAVATELATAKIVTVTDPWTSAQVEISFAKPV